jgi:hypothetical protein
MKLHWKVFLRFIAAACSILALAAASPYWFWYPRIPWANFTIEGQPSENLALYWHRSGRTLVVIRPSDRGRETYFVNIGDPKSQEKDFSRSFVASCADSSILVYKLIAIQNHQQRCQPFFMLESDDARQTSKKIERILLVGHRSFEFYCDDGRRITARW